MVIHNIELVKHDRVSGRDSLKVQILRWGVLKRVDERTIRFLVRNGL